MIVDTSAIMAILRQEPDAPAFGAALAREPRVAISAATLVELCMVAESRAGRPEHGQIEQDGADAEHAVDDGPAQEPVDVDGARPQDPDRDRRTGQRDGDQRRW